MRFPPGRVVTRSPAPPHLAGAGFLQVVLGCDHQRAPRTVRTPPACGSGQLENERETPAPRLAPRPSLYYCECESGQPGRGFPAPRAPRSAPLANRGASPAPSPAVAQVRPLPAASAHRVLGPALSAFSVFSYKDKVGFQPSKSEPLSRALWRDVFAFLYTRAKDSPTLQGGRYFTGAKQVGSGDTCMYVAHSFLHLATHQTQCRCADETTIAKLSLRHSEKPDMADSILLLASQAGCLSSFLSMGLEPPLQNCN
nr:uncharacterized protein LOC123567619 [Macaca fascicularis]